MRSEISSLAKVLELECTRPYRCANIVLSKNPSTKDSQSFGVSASTGKMFKMTGTMRKIDFHMN